LYEDNYTITEILLVVIEYYELEEDIELTICIQYVTHVGVNRTRTWVRLCEHERIKDQQIRTEEGVQRKLTIDEDYSAICHEEQW
jgi:hypothetical protein